jgi:hypothetical protein
VLAFGDRFHLRVGEAGGAAQAVLARLPDRLKAAGVRLDRLQPVPPSLEDVFISLLQAQANSLARGGQGGAHG